MNSEFDTTEINNSLDNWDEEDTAETEEEKFSSNISIVDDDDSQIIVGQNIERGPLDVFRASDDLEQINILKKIFSEKEIKELSETYKEEEASQAELLDDDLEHNIRVRGLGKDDYYFLKYIEKHQDILIDKETEIAEVLDMD